MNAVRPPTTRDDAGRQAGNRVPLTSVPAAWRSPHGATARDSGLAVFDQAVVSGTSFVTTILVGRLDGPGELGLYALGLTLVVLIAGVQESLVSVSYTILGSRLQGPAQAEYAGSVLVHHWLLAGLAIVGLALAGVVVSTGVGPPRLAPVIWTLAATIPLVLWREFCRRLAFADWGAASALGLDVSVATLQIVGLAGLAASGWLSAVTAHGVVGLACAGGGLVWFGLTRPRFTVRWRQVVVDSGRSWSFGKWILAAQVTSVTHGYALHWLLALIRGAAATGRFAACEAVVLLSNPLVLGIGNILTPRAARAFAAGGGMEVRRVVGQAALLLGAAMGGFVVLAALFGGEALRLLYGGQYAGYEHVVTVMAVALLAGAPGNAFDVGLRALGRSDVSFQVSLLGLGVTLLTASFLVLWWGILGAALGFLAGRVAGTVARWVALLRLTRHSPLDATRVGASA